MAIRVPSKTNLLRFGYVEGRALSCPLLVQPDNGSTTITATTASLAWASVVNAKTYRVYIWPANEDEPDVYDYDAETTALGYLATGLSPGVTYRWRATAFSVFGASTECGYSTFTTSGVPNCPALVFPEDESTTLGSSSVTLSWTALANATSYNVFLWPSVESMPVTPTASTTDTSYNATGLESSTEYSWTVQGVNDAGASFGCGSNSFTTRSTSVEFTASVYPSATQAGAVTISVQRSGSTVGAASVQYATSDGTAVAGVNYTAASGTLNWADSDGANKTFDVSILDGEDYNSLLLNLTLSNPVGTTIGDQGTAVVTIPALYVFVSTHAVNIDANNFKNASEPGAPGGTVVTVTAGPTDRIIITKPTIASDPGLTWDAWSAFSTNGVNGGLTWLNNFRLSNGSDTLLLDKNLSPVAYATPAGAQAALAAETPITFTGETVYKFWEVDIPTSDNRGGLSLRVEVWSLIA